MRKVSHSKLLLISLLAVLGVAFLTACNRQAETGSSAQSEAPEKPAAAVEEPKPKAVEEGDAEEGVEVTDVGRAVIETDKGTMVLELYPDVAPKTVANFVKLIGAGFYNGLTFHRVVPGFVIQGGDPKGDGTGGPGYTIEAEFSSKPHVRGTLAMARSSDPNSAGSQFYIALDRAPHLDNNYTVFGQLVEGMDVIDKIEVGDVMKRVYIDPATIQE
jgi:cyclophilin family peptidyl-prolyl cis-trans isomerase